MDLATKNVEQIRGFSHVGNLHVAVLVLAIELALRGEETGVLIAELQPTLHSTRGMLRSLTVVTMGQVHNQTRSLEPLGFTSGDELVDDTLGVVREITKLCLPHHKCIRRSQRVSIFETKTVIIASQCRFFKKKKKKKARNLHSIFTQ